MSTPRVLPETVQLLFQLAPRLTRLENALLKELPQPLTFRQYRFLLRVAEGSSTLTELRTPSTLSLAAVSESVDLLVQRGLLARAVDPLDRRAIAISITPNGRRALSDATSVLDRLGSELVEEIGVEDAERLRDVLDLITARVTDRLRSRHVRA